MSSSTSKYLTPQQHLEHKTLLYWRLSRYIQGQSTERFRVGESLTIIRNTEKDYKPEKLVIRKLAEIKHHIIFSDYSADRRQA